MPKIVSHISRKLLILRKAVYFTAPLAAT